MFNVIEDFMSIQGEGAFSGKLVHFLRFAGCSLRCRWCDTSESWSAGGGTSRWESCKSVYDLHQWLEGVAKEKVPLVLTGGEPTEQDVSLMKLLCDICGQIGISIHVETNGMQYVSWLACADHITVSPKISNTLHLSDEETAFRGGKTQQVIAQCLAGAEPTGVSIKFVLDLSDLGELAILDDFFLGLTKVMDFWETGIPVYLQPVSEGVLDFAVLGEWKKLLQKHPQFDVRFSVQLHKVLGVV